jgi:protein-S-isoprenylcysteine O-methyltransferase Ste14
MRTRAAALGSAIFFALAPGSVAGLIPWSLTGWRLGRTFDNAIALRIFGTVSTAAGVVFLVQAFVRFVVDGLGTPAPIAPTEWLVVSGPYRFVRNPMYLAVLATILGQALLLWRLVLVVYAVIAAGAFVAFVLG